MISYSSLLTDEGNYIQVQTTEDFMILHYTIDCIVQQWSLQGPTHHPFYVKWQKWLMQGLSEDNMGALLMANAQQPTRRTRHMGIKYFALQDWVASDLIILKDISTSDNAADAFTKVLSKQLFHRHYDTFMGRRVPDYWQSIIGHLVPTPDHTLDHDTPCVLHSTTEHGEGIVGTIDST